jgi:hypothetical protein
MAVISVPGYTFTVSVGAGDVTAQITDGSITTTPTVERVRTLGPNVAFVGTDVEYAADLNFLYDDDAGFYMTLADAATANTALTASITGGGGTWTGTLYLGTLSVSYAADGLSSCSASFVGDLVFAATGP